MVAPLGTVVATSGTLLILDPGYLPLWAHDREPIMPPGELADEATEEANDSVDVAFVGPDALALGARIALQWDPRYVFDVPRVDLDLLHERIRRAAIKHGLTAHAEVLAERIPHRRRVDLALEHGRGAGEVLFHGIWAAVVAVPPGPLRVIAEAMPADHVHRALARRVSIVASERAVARTERVGLAAVDHGELVVVDVDAAGSPAEAMSRGCVFSTTWGDGLFDVVRDLDADGALVQARVELGTDERSANWAPGGLGPLARSSAVPAAESALVEREVRDQRGGLAFVITRWVISTGGRRCRSTRPCGFLASLVFVGAGVRSNRGAGGSGGVAGRAGAGVGGRGGAGGAGA
jgi:hypothetical protein